MKDQRLTMHRRAIIVTGPNGDRIELSETEERKTIRLTIVVGKDTLAETELDESAWEALRSVVQRGAWDHDALRFAVERKPATEPEPAIEDEDDESCSVCGAHPD